MPISKILILGGTHGVEPQSTYVVERLAEHFKLEIQRIAEWDQLFKFYRGKTESGLELFVIPDLNRYGLENNSRGNIRGVDLNRNMPAANWSSNYTNMAYFPGTHPASEPEVKALVKIIQEQKFGLIISLHTNHYVANPNPPQVNYDGMPKTFGYAVALKLSMLLGLPLTDDIGYPTPGSLGSYAKDLNIPCITLEMDDKYSEANAWAKYGAELITIVKDIIRIRNDESAAA